MSVVSFIVTLLFIIPLQLKKAGVKNGLAQLRKKQLAKGFLSLFMSAVTVVVLAARFFFDGITARYMTITLVFLFTLSWLIKQLIESSIYHTQFTVDQIELHDAIAATEENNKKRRKAYKKKHDN